MENLKRRLATLFAALLSAAIGIQGCAQSEVSTETLDRVYGESTSSPKTKLKVLYIGHSLVGRSIPHMVRQLAGDGHEYSSQLGWGTKLRYHWDPSLKIKGYEFVTTFSEYPSAIAAIESGEYDAFVLTEGVEIKDAIKYHDSKKYLTKFVKLIDKHNPGARIYFYETWHNTDDEEGWIQRIERDYSMYWLDQILYPTLETTGGTIPVYVIPAGQVLKAFFENLGDLESTVGKENFSYLFKLRDDGTQDKIHLNDIGAYLVALVHYSVMYQSPAPVHTLPLKRANEREAAAPTLEIAEYMQEISWEVVSKDFRTGLIQYKQN